MDKSIQITLIIVAGFVILALIGLVAFNNLNPSLSDTVSVSGQSTIKATPDKVGVYFSVEYSGKTSSEARDKVAGIVKSLEDSLIAKGFNKKDIQTKGYNIYPEYDWINNQQKLKGYKATQSIVLEIPKERFDDVGEVIDTGVDSGALINSINFELSQEKQNEYKAQAMKEAAEDAKIKAESVARGLNKRVGKLVSVSVSNFDYYPWRIYAAESGTMDVAMAKQATTNIQPGEQEISASVSAVFKIY